MKKSSSLRPDLNCAGFQDGACSKSQAIPRETIRATAFSILPGAADFQCRREALRSSSENLYRECITLNRSRRPPSHHSPFSANHIHLATGNATPPTARPSCPAPAHPHRLHTTTHSAAHQLTPAQRRTGRVRTSNIPAIDARMRLSGKACLRAASSTQLLQLRLASGPNPHIRCPSSAGSPSTSTVRSRFVDAQRRQISAACSAASSPHRRAGADEEVSTKNVTCRTACIHDLRIARP